MADYKEIAKSVGKTIGTSVVKTGVFIGNRVAEGYRAIDPDVKRHIAQLPLLSYSLFVSRREAIEPGRPDGHPPLIFVHGLGGNRGNFLLMSWHLWMQGRKRSYKIHFESGQTIDQMAAALAHFIHDVLDATAEKEVDIVAHSMGGIVARLAIDDYELNKNVKALVTLGTPHKGTYPARYANTETAKSLRPDSPLIQKLRENGWPKGVRGVTLWSRNDLFVLPAQSAVMEETEQAELTPFTHYSYLIDPKGWVAVDRALKGESPIVEPEAVLTES